MRATKKDQIADAAMPLFLEHGFKGTSIDMVVKAAGVSKPTIYNHFPDKATVMNFVMSRWLSTQEAMGLDVQASSLTEALAASISGSDAFKFYRLVLSEGWRFPAARAAFFEQYEERWRQVVSQWAKHRGVLDAQAQAMYSDFVLKQLWVVA